jgi:hypothetical protein
VAHDGLYLLARRANAGHAEADHGHLNSASSSLILERLTVRRDRL